MGRVKASLTSAAFWAMRSSAGKSGGGKSSEGRGKELCKFFFDGRCFSGANCPFSHGDALTAATEEIIDLPRSAASQLQRDWSLAETLRNDLLTLSRKFQVTAELEGLQRVVMRPEAALDTLGDAYDELQRLLDFYFPADASWCLLCDGAGCYHCSRCQGCAECRKEKAICKFFLEGRCTRGASCTFSHDAWISNDQLGGRAQPYSDEKGGKSSSGKFAKGDGGKGVCKFFLEGRCTHGESCAFLHDASGVVEEDYLDDLCQLDGALGADDRGDDDEQPYHGYKDEDENGYDDDAEMMEHYEEFLRMQERQAQSGRSGGSSGNGGYTSTAQGGSGGYSPSTTDSYSGWNYSGDHGAQDAETWATPGGDAETWGTQGAQRSGKKTWW